jgi:hypothetical protein
MNHLSDGDGLLHLDALRFQVLVALLDGDELDASRFQVLVTWFVLRFGTVVAWV